MESNFSEGIRSFVKTSRPWSMSFWGGSYSDYLDLFSQAMSRHPFSFQEGLPLHQLFLSAEKLSLQWHWPGWGWSIEGVPRRKDAGQPEQRRFGLIWRWTSPCSNISLGLEWDWAWRLRMMMLMKKYKVSREKVLVWENDCHVFNRKTRGWAALLEKLHYLVIPADKEHRSKGFWRMSKAEFGGSVIGIYRSSFPFSQDRWSSREWQPQLGWCTRRAIAFVHHCRWFLGAIDLYGIEVG